MSPLKSGAQVSQRITDGVERRPCPDDGTALGGDRQLFYGSLDGQDVLVGCGDQFYATVTVTVSAVDADPISTLDNFCGAMKTVDAADAADRSGGDSQITISPAAVGGGGIITRC